MDRRPEGRGGFQAAAAIAAAEVSASAYYEWVRAHAQGPTLAEYAEAYLVNEIIDIHRIHDDYGSLCMTQALRRRGCRANRKRVERLMREFGIYATDARRAKVRTTIPGRLRVRFSAATSPWW